MKRTFAILATIPAIWILFHLLSGGAVLTAGNMVNLFKYLTVVGILSTGMTFVMGAGHIDLSVGSGLGLLGAVNALLLDHLHWPLAALPPHQRRARRSHGPFAWRAGGRAPHTRIHRHLERVDGLYGPEAIPR